MCNQSCTNIFCRPCLCKNKKLSRKITLTKNDDNIDYKIKKCLPTVYWANMTLYEAKQKYTNWKDKIRSIARQTFREINPNKCCERCSYTLYTEICHIQAISDFNDDTTISTINSISNLCQLCPNCHYELDHKLWHYDSLNI